VSNPNFTVVPAALRAEAAVWENQAAAMRDVRGTISSLELNGWQAGLFFFMVGDYMDVVDQIASLTTGGANEFDNIASALRENAASYEASDVAAGSEFPHVKEGF
jgi:hypothetical protein